MIGKYVPALGICARCTKNTTPGKKLCGACARLIAMVRAGKPPTVDSPTRKSRAVLGRVPRDRSALVLCPSCGIKVEPGALERHRARERH